MFVLLLPASTCLLLIAGGLSGASPSGAAGSPRLDPQKIAEAAGTKTSVSDDGVVRIAWARDDVKVTVDGMPLKPFAGLGSWAAFTWCPCGGMVMGDTVVFEDEITPAMDAAFAARLHVTALHNHFVYDEPKVYFMHLTGDGDAAKLAAGVKATWEAIRKVRAARPEPARSFPGPKVRPGSISADLIEQTLKEKTQTQDGVVKVTIGRKGRMGQLVVGGSMGLTTWAAFSGSDELAAVDGDFIMTANEVQPVLRALRKNDIHIVALHNHMIGEEPTFYFTHFWGKGGAKQLAAGIRAALDAQKNAPAGGAENDDAAVGMWDFDRIAPGQTPAGWSIRQNNPTRQMGRWIVAADKDAPSPPNVLQLKTDNERATFNLSIIDSVQAKDVELSVKLRADSGEVDQGGGLIWRVKDENNYYICRINPLENNYRVYRVVNGKREQLQSADAESPTGKWVTVRVVMIGNHIRCYLDDHRLLDVNDATFQEPGRVGLWTKADASSSFDDFAVRRLTANDGARK